MNLPFDFPYEYSGGGYFRMKGVPAGEKAPILHGMEAIYEYERLRCEAEAAKKTEQQEESKQ